jgi:hypothetical protein
VPAPVVTATRTVPAAFAGAVTEIDVALLETIVAELPPNVTAEGLARLVPVMITVIPPLVGPDVGLILEIVGADILIQKKIGLSLSSTNKRTL